MCLCKWKRNKLGRWLMKNRDPPCLFFSRRIKQMRCELVKRKKKGNLLLYFILKRNDNTRETSVNYWEECHYNLRNAVMRGGQVSNEEIERKLPIEKTSRYCSDDAIIFVFFFSRAHKEGRICGLLHVFFLQKKRRCNITSVKKS